MKKASVATTTKTEGGEIADASAGLPEEMSEVISVSKIMLTPERAAKYLKLMAPNRKIRSGHLEYIKRNLSQDTYTLSPNPIVFDRLGRLIDGQHRCQAVVDTGISIPVMKSVGWPVKVQQVIDHNAPRCLRDTLTFMDETNTSSRSALLKLIWQYENNPEGHWNAVKPTENECLEILERDRELIDRVLEIKRSLDRIRGRKEAALCFYLFLKKDASAAEEFYMQLLTGAHLQVGNPVIPLRAYLLTAENRTHLACHKNIGTIIHAWNSWRTGRELKTIRFYANRDLPEII